MEKSEKPPAWFADIIIDGLKTLYTLIPPSGRPASDQMGVTSRTWVGVIYKKPIFWQRELDAERMTKAWDIVYGEVTEWITPAQYMDKLPPRPKQQALPAPKYPADKARENIAKIQAMLRDKVKTIPH